MDRGSLRVLAAVVAVFAVLPAAAAGRRAEPAAAPGAGGVGAVPVEVHHRDDHPWPSDTFWDKVRAGAEQAAGDGVDLSTPTARTAPPKRWCRTRSTARSTGSPSPDPGRRRRSGREEAADAGIPVVAFNGGITDYRVQHLHVLQLR